MLIDTHTHLYFPNYQNDLDEVITRSLNADVKLAIVVGVDIPTSQQASKFNHPKLTTYSSIGIHPDNAINYLSNTNESIQSDINILRNMYNSNPQKILAIGECGLDFFFDTTHIANNNSEPIDNEKLKHIQSQLFKSQIDLAHSLSLPLIVHIRDDRTADPDNITCWREALSMLSNSFGFLHCYSGKAPITKAILEGLVPNFLISFAANITYPKNEYLRLAIQDLPLNRIALETDSPFLSPQSNRGKRNEPASVKEIASLIAELKNLSLEEVANQTTQNAKSLLNI